MDWSKYSERLIENRPKYNFEHPDHINCVDMRYNQIISKNAYTSKPVEEIKDVIFNNPATIVFWTDGTKTVVKVNEGETFDPEKGIAMAIAKKHFGNKGNYYNHIKKWVDKYTEECSDVQEFDFTFPLSNKSAEKLLKIVKDALPSFTMEFKHKPSDFEGNH